MAQVNVTIAGRTYRMGCEDGQQAEIQGLAARLDQTISELKATVGELGDQRLTVMAAIMALSEAADAGRRIAALDAENKALARAAAEASEGQRRHEAETAARLDGAARRIERLAAVLSGAKPAAG